MDGRWGGLRAEVRTAIDELGSSGRESGVQVAAYLAERGQLNYDWVGWPAWTTPDWPR